jgi:predicted transcriptional regulator
MMYYICLMKRTILTVEIDPELKEHLDKQADKKKVNLSRYVRAALIKVSSYKERKIV